MAAFNKRRGILSAGHNDVQVIKTVAEASAFPARSWLCLTCCGLMILMGYGSNSNSNMNSRRKEHPHTDKPAQSILSHKAKEFTFMYLKMESPRAILGYLSRNIHVQMIALRSTLYW